MSIYSLNVLSTNYLGKHIYFELRSKYWQRYSGATDPISDKIFSSLTNDKKLIL